jgi:type I protein arginine methyltransferase
VEYYFQRYADLELQRRMVGDRPRTSAFHRAIQEVVKPGDTVLDVGTGTGLLAMFAAQAGAERVYAVDQSPVLASAKAVLAQNAGLAVEILEGPAASTRPPRPVDVLVSEWLGNLAYVEGMLDAVLAARDHSLSKNGAMLPSHVEVLIAPIDDPVLYLQSGPGYWREPVFGLDYSALEARELAQGRSVQIRVEAGALLSAGAIISGLDLKKAKPGDWFTKGSVTVEIKRDGVMSGFAGWFKARLSPSVVLDTSPGELDTHWAQTYFPFRPRPVKKGEKMRIDYELRKDPEEPRFIRVDLGIGDETIDYRIE